ncbi:MAG: hypothetical protein COW84_12205 [Gammaproteobacteria bacterium CG22_combo_CG10-13_8_21_14_all_40_8]|nr:MAG: hypothetical protein COW84_12205 [Gammaproteobacteria bacterium CG22_combo_CG10-13_8_21_14_all_40_8]
MPPDNKQSPPRTLVHFTSSKGGKEKALATEVVKPKSASAQFLQKMELKRQSQPTNLLIDLRKKTKEPCYPYEYRKLIHHLNEAGIEIFENEIHRFHGLYTMGVYEKVTKEALLPPSQRTPSQPPISIAHKNTPKISAEAEKAVISPPESKPPVETEYPEVAPNLLAEEKIEPLNIVDFGYSPQRTEERMTYIMPALLSDLSGDEILAKTIDISVHGVRVKLDTSIFWQKGDEVLIEYPNFPLKSGIHFEPSHYKIIDVIEEHPHTICCLQLIENPVHQEIIEELSKFIESYRLRYKIDLEDAIQSLSALFFERIYTQNSHSIPLFFEEKNDKINLRTVLRNGAHNWFESPLFQHILGRLGNLLTQRRHNNKLIRENGPENIIVYAFESNFLHNKWQTFIALESDFSTLHQLHQFLNIAMKSEHFQAWKLLISPTVFPTKNREQNIIEPLIDISHHEKESALKQIASFKVCGFLCEINQQVKLPKMPEVQEPVNHILERFLVSSQQLSRYEKLHVPYFRKREENRYYLTTQVVAEIAGIIYQGTTIDFSPGGVKILFDESVKAAIREDAILTFEGLKARFKNVDVSKQRYRVVHLSDDQHTVSFSRDHRYAKHAAAIFFKRLIDNNQAKLNMCASDIWMEARSLLFESIVCNSTPTLPFFINGQHKNWKIDTIAINHQHYYREHLLNESPQVNIAKIIPLPQWEKILDNALDKRRNFIQLYETELYLYRDNETQNIVSSFEFDFKTFQNRNSFIKKALKQTQYTFYKLIISPIVEVNTSLINDQLQELRVHSKHKAMIFSDYVKQLAAMGEFIDITPIVIRELTHLNL